MSKQNRVRFVRDGALYEPCQLMITKYGDKVKLTYFKKLLRAPGLEEAADKRRETDFSSETECKRGCGR